MFLCPFCTNEATTSQVFLINRLRYHVIMCGIHAYQSKHDKHMDQWCVANRFHPAVTVAPIKHPSIKGVSTSCGK